MASVRFPTSLRRMRSYANITSGPPISSRRRCADSQLANGRSVAQAQIKALSADRRHDMGGFADECDAVVGKAPCRRDVKREQSNTRV